MTTHTFSTPDSVRMFLAQCLILQRTKPMNIDLVRHTLEWTLEIVGGGAPTPVLGFVGDVGQIALFAQYGDKLSAPTLNVPGLPTGLMPRYDDFVLGKLFDDVHFDRASDALRRYDGRDRAKGIAFMIQQFAERADLWRVELNPAEVRTLLREPPESLVQFGNESMYKHGVLPEILQGYESLITGVRRAGEILNEQDAIEIEQRIALEEFGERLAYRQILDAAQTLEADLPPYKLIPVRGWHEVPTRVYDEDTYPVGGYSSLSTRGSIESLLFSQLAYMEKDDRPDLFDIKFLRDELLYYSRDENQFLRRRRTYVFVLYPDLIHARFKDPQLPWQRIVLLLGWIVTTVRKLSEWLTTDALLFEIVFVHDRHSKDKDTHPLDAEKLLLERLLADQIANGTVVIDFSPHPTAVARHCAQLARRSLCHCLSIGNKLHPLTIDDTIVSRLSLRKQEPKLEVDGDLFSDPDVDTPLRYWSVCLEQILQLWL